jgi:hypothetical protein
MSSHGNVVDVAMKLQIGSSRHTQLNLKLKSLALLLRNKDAIVSLALITVNVAY